MSNTTIPDYGNQTIINDTSIQTASNLDLSSLSKLEFGIFMIPVYYFIIIALMKICCADKDNTLYVGNPPQNSFTIKRRLSLVLAGLSFAKFMLSLLQSPDSNWVSNSKSLSLFYLFGVLAWWLSAKLLEIEGSKGQPQEIYSHRLFWIAQFLVACFRFNQPFSVSHSIEIPSHFVLDFVLDSHH